MSSLPRRASVPHHQPGLICEGLRFVLGI
uniref:Uncharacterized protein n=1 Tax=Arundo donax TaxID=35708 RepID=A0A0A9FRT2_ARUDO